MISNSNSVNKIVKGQLNDKKLQYSQIDSQLVAGTELSLKQKIMKKGQSQKPIKIKQIRNLYQIQKNERIKDQSQNQESFAFSALGQDKVNITVKKLNEYFQKVNSNGFSRYPPSFTQILPLVFVFSIIIQITLVSWHCMAKIQSYIMFGIMSFLFIPIAYFWYKTTSIDPTDTIQLQHLQFIKDPQKSSFQPEKHKYFCILCKTCISERSFHCNRCNRCVNNFDHHCKWLNNCIGANNYVEFIQLVAWSEIFMLFFFICNTIFILKIINENNQIPSIVWFIVSITVVPFIALSILLCLQLYLIMTKRTTIQLILQSKGKNKIHPQKSTKLMLKKRIGAYLPQQSPADTPISIVQNSLLRNMKEQSNKSLKRFMKNLTNNLNLAKNSNNQASSQQQQAQCQKKIAYNPTIFKQTSWFIKENSKSTPLEINKIIKELLSSAKQQQGFQQNHNLNDFTSEQSKMKQIATNLLLRLNLCTQKKFFKYHLNQKQGNKAKSKNRNIKQIENETLAVFKGILKSERLQTNIKQKKRQIFRKKILMRNGVIVLQIDKNQNQKIRKIKIKKKSQFIISMKLDFFKCFLYKTKRRIGNEITN